MLLAPATQEGGAGGPVATPALEGGGIRLQGGYAPVA